MRLPGSGAVAVALGAGLAGGLYDVLTGPGLRLAFAISFVVGCAVGALLVRRRDLLVAVVMPPLVYVAVALVAVAVQGTSAPGSWVVRQALDLFTALVLQAPALMAATGVALVIALARGLGRRRQEQQVDVAAR
ncbi:MAG: hypothetical protein JWO60_445 [Frankiales bacterium]|nr:hypothetical protein [Frankiales bacterium]